MSKYKIPSDKNLSNLPLSALPKQLANLPIIFVGGKGGVGKTTTAAALAVNFASMHQRTLLISTDPAHSLGDIFEASFVNTATTIVPCLDVIELDPDKIIETHFANVERTISGYANPDMLPKIREHLKLSKSAPGAGEAAMLEAICQHLVDGLTAGYEHIIFDTAPTGHTLRLLVLPEMMAAWTDGLLTQQRRQAKLKSAAERLTPKKNTPSTTHVTTDSKNSSGGTFKSNDRNTSQLANPFSKQTAPDRWQQAVEVLNKRKNLFKRAGELLHDKNKTAIVLVMTADTLPINETKRAAAQLQDSNMPVRAIVVNQLIHDEQTDDFWQGRAARQQCLLSVIHRIFAEYSIYHSYLQQTDVKGVPALQAFMQHS